MMNAHVQKQSLILKVKLKMRMTYCLILKINLH